MRSDTTQELIDLLRAEVDEQRIMGEPINAGAVLAAADALQAASEREAKLREEVDAARFTISSLEAELQINAGKLFRAEAALATAREDALEDARDARRYRWLRQQRWHCSALAVVSEPKQSVKLGVYCPSDEQLDGIIDASLRALLSKEPDNAG